MHLLLLSSNGSNGFTIEYDSEECYVEYCWCLSEYSRLCHIHRNVEFKTARLSRLAHLNKRFGKEEIATEDTTHSAKWEIGIRTNYEYECRRDHCRKCRHRINNIRFPIKIYR